MHHVVTSALLAYKPGDQRHEGIHLFAIDADNEEKRRISPVDDFVVALLHK
jgi:hypothetical protein